MKKLMFYMAITTMFFRVCPYVKSHVKSVKTKAANKELVIASNVDFRGADLSGIDLTNAQLSGANFGVATKKSNTVGVVSIPGQKTNVQKVNFSGSKCISTNFEKANLQNSNFTGAIILNANFSNANLTGAILEDLIFQDQAVFCGAVMPDGTTLTGNKSWKNKKGQIFYAHCPQKK